MISSESKLKLESMQVRGIKKMIWDNIPEEELMNRLLQIKRQGDIRDLSKFLQAQSRNTLITLVECSPEITDSMINIGYEKYRYGLKPSFTLFWAKNPKRDSIRNEELNMLLTKYTKELKYDEDAKYKNLRFVNSTLFNNDIYEINFNYLQKINFINEQEEFDSVYGINECFAWISVKNNFVAINNMPDIIMHCVQLIFCKIFGVNITNVKITNSLIKRVFQIEKLKKETKQNSNPPANQLAKITYSDPKLNEKQDYIPEGYENYKVTNSQYAKKLMNSQQVH